MNDVWRSRINVISPQSSFSLCLSYFAFVQMPIWSAHYPHVSYQITLQNVTTLGFGLEGKISEQHSNIHTFSERFLKSLNSQHGSFNAVLILTSDYYCFSYASSLFSLITSTRMCGDQWLSIRRPAAVCQTCRKCSGGHQNWRACPQSHGQSGLN